MTVNMVTVTINIDGSPADTAGPEGNYVFSPAGVMWPDLSGNPLTPMVVHATLTTTLVPPLATASVQLVASDNFAAGVLTWDVIINVRGMPTINVANVPVNFASGATQSIWTILQTAGWTPTVQP
jgi:hypothetical protein